MEASEGKRVLLLPAADIRPNPRQPRQVFEEAGLRELADRIAACCGGVAAVFSGENGSYGFCLASREEDLRPLGKRLTQALHGRGGGKPGFQQGTVKASRQEIEALFRDQPIT